MSALFNNVINIPLAIANASSSNPQLDEALADLADISLGRTPSIWPLAWGWWALIVITTLVLVAAAWLMVMYIKKNKQKRKALRAIQQIDESSAQAFTQLHAILRSTAIHYYGPEQISGLQGSAWQTFLSSKTTHNKSISQDLARKLSQLETSMYKRTPSIAVNDAKNAVAQWIKQCVPARGVHHV